MDIEERLKSVLFLCRVPLEGVKHIQSIIEIMSSTSEANNTSLIGCAGIFLVTLKAKLKLTLLSKSTLLKDAGDSV